MSETIRIRQIKGASGHPKDQQQTISALGIHRLHQVIEHNDTPQIRGMIFKVRHLVEVVDG
jgi:large subunit ribosomal protein L30